MGLTNFPNGILATPNLGSGLGKFAGLWTSRVWFVDGTNGNDANAGDMPTQAFKTIQQGITKASKDDTIYIRPQVVGTRYTETMNIPITTHAGLNLIGTSASKGNSVYQAVSIRSAASATAATLITYPSFVNLENLHFWSRSTQTEVFGVEMSWNTRSGLNIGSSIVNCAFTQDVDDSPAGAGVLQKAIRLDSTEGVLIERCFLHDCRIGVAIQSTVSASYKINLMDNLFSGLAANMSADIYITDCTGVQIVGNVFGHAVPSNAAGLVKFVYVVGTATGTMAANFQGENEVAAATNNTLSSIISAGNFGLGGPWTS